jgi:hypothetical protein
MAGVGGRMAGMAGVAGIRDGRDGKGWQRWQEVAGICCDGELQESWHSASSRRGMSTNIKKEST